MQVSGVSGESSPLWARWRSSSAVAPAWRAVTTCSGLRLTPIGLIDPALQRVVLKFLRFVPGAEFVALQFDGGPVWIGVIERHRYSVIQAGMGKDPVSLEPHESIEEIVETLCASDERRPAQLKEPVLRR